MCTEDKAVANPLCSPEKCLRCRKQLSDYEIMSASCDTCKPSSTKYKPYYAHMDEIDSMYARRSSKVAVTAEGGIWTRNQGM